MSTIYTPVKTLYSSLNVLTVYDVYKLELGKFMYKLNCNSLPFVFLESFKRINEIHTYNTRQLSTMKYFLPRVFKSIGQSILSYRGINFWNSIDNE